jgi:hypothetical protein
MRDRTQRRNWSEVDDEFRREHHRHRQWGLARRHARKSCRLNGCSRQCGEVGLHDSVDRVPPLIWPEEATLLQRPVRSVPVPTVPDARDSSAGPGQPPTGEQSPSPAGPTDRAPTADQALDASPAAAARSTQGGCSEQGTRAKAASPAQNTTPAPVTTRPKVASAAEVTSPVHGVSPAEDVDPVQGASAAEAISPAHGVSPTEDVDPVQGASAAEVARRAQGAGHAQAAEPGNRVQVTGSAQTGTRAATVRPADAGGRGGAAHQRESDDYGGSTRRGPSGPDHDSRLSRQPARPPLPSPQRQEPNRNDERHRGNSQNETAIRLRPEFGYRAFRAPRI